VQRRGGLAAFQPSLPSLEGLVLKGGSSFDGRLPGLLAQCSALRSLQLQRVFEGSSDAALDLTLRWT
jgi:hypothetical protein